MPFLITLKINESKGYFLFVSNLSSNWNVKYIWFVENI